MALIDQLEAVLGKDAIAKIKADPNLTKHITKGDEFYRMYVGVDDDETESATTTTTTTDTTRRDPPATTSTTTTNFDLSSIESMLDKKLGNLPEMIKKTTTDTVEEMLKTRATEVIGVASAQALRQSDELNRVYRRHEKEFGEDFDSGKFNEFVEGAQKANQKFSSVTNAYEEFTKDRRLEKKLTEAKTEGAREALKERAKLEVPGFTPTSARSPIATFLNRGKATDTDNRTAAQRAGQALSDRLAAHANGE